MTKTLYVTFLLAPLSWTNALSQTTAKDTPKPETVTVPEWLKGKDFQLNADKTPVDLSGESVTVTPSLEPVAIDLYDGSGRLVDHRREYYDKDIFNDLKVRNMRLTIGLGSANTTDAAEWKTVFLSGDRFQVSASFDWFLVGGLGVNVMTKLHTQSNELEEGVTASYTGLLMGSSLFYEIAPFKRAKNYWRKITVTPSLGLFYGWHHLRMNDDQISMRDHDRSIGYMAGLKIRFPIANNFSLFFEWAIMKQTIEFNKFDAHIDEWHNSLILGGEYAF